MAEDTVVREQLTETMIEAGSRLVVKLDEVGQPPAAAFWLWDPDRNDWHLHLAFPDVSKRGSGREFASMVMQTAESLPRADADCLFLTTWIDDINTPLERMIRKVIQTPNNAVNRFRFSRNTIDGHYIDDALIYRMT